MLFSFTLAFLAAFFALFAASLSAFTKERWASFSALVDFSGLELADRTA